MGITSTFFNICVFILLNYNHARAETLTLCKYDTSSSDSGHIARVTTTTGTTAFYDLPAMDDEGGCVSFNGFVTTGDFVSIDIQQCAPNAGDGITFSSIKYGATTINSFPETVCKRSEGLRIDSSRSSQDPANLCESVNVDADGTVTSNVNAAGNFVDAVFDTACENSNDFVTPAPTTKTNSPTNSPTVHVDSGSSDDDSSSDEYEYFGAKSEMDLDENDDEEVVNIVLKFSDNVWVNLWCVFGAAILICILAYLSFYYRKNQ